jgi:hypothetical protein
MKPIKYLIPALIFALIVVPMSASLSIAKTPDGKTPAEEDACDEEFGAAYGLCVAYCEAMDCDSENQRASDEACDRVFNGYVQQTGFEPPCEDEPLPQ